MIVCLGDLLEDVVVWMAAPITVGTDTPATIVRRRGGSASNVAAFVAQIGGRSRFLGTVGQDPLGEQLVRQLGETGADVSASRRGRTGSIIVMVSADGERSFLTDRGSSSEVDPIHSSEWETATWFHVPAYGLARDPLATVATNALLEARHAGVGISVDCSSVALLLDYGIERFHAWLDLVDPDVVFANEQEAAVLELPDRWQRSAIVVVKHGPKPVELVGRDGSRTLVSVPAVAEVLDATGAGDAFAAAFLHALTGGATPEQSVEAGNRLAARVLSEAGAMLGR